MRAIFSEKEILKRGIIYGKTEKLICNMELVFTELAIKKTIKKELKNKNIKKNLMVYFKMCIGNALIINFAKGK